MQHFLLAVNRMVAFRTQAGKPITLLWALSVAVVAQPVERQPLNCDVMGSSPTWYRIFSHVCAHFGMCSGSGIILSRFWLRGQLQYRTALGLMYSVTFGQNTIKPSLLTCSGFG